MMDVKLSSRVLSVGVYYKNNAPGGMASVADSYSKSFHKYSYVSSWKTGNKLTKFVYLTCALVQVIWQLCFNRSISILHIHTAAHASFYRKSLFVLLGRIFNKKILMHIHASQFKVFYSQSNWKGLIRKILNLCDLVLVLSNSWKDYFIAIGVDHKKLAVLNNIVHPPSITIAPVSFNFPVKYLFLGEIGDRKGIFDLLNVIADNKELFKDNLHLLIGGNGEVKRLIDFINQNELNSFVTFLGWVSDESKQEALLTSDVFILPSYNEGLPIAILEAMSYGKPIISTDIGGIAEIVKDKYNGCLILPGDYNAIKESLSFFIDNPHYINEFGNRSLKVVKAYYAENVMVELKKIYEQCLAG